MDYDTIIYEVADGGARITLNRPEKLNATTLAMVGELADALRRADASEDVRAVLVSGAGRGFSTGHDLGSPRKSGDDDPREPLRDHYLPALNVLRGLKKPTLAAVNGPCAGASVALALSCDIVIAAESAFFLSAFVRVGLVPDSGVSWLLPNAVGSARANAMMLLGEKIPARDAADWGMIWKCVPDDQLAATADDLLGKLATGPTRTYGAIKQLVRMSQANSLAEQMQAEADIQAVIRTTDDAMEAKKAFVEGRSARFAGK